MTRQSFCDAVAMVPAAAPYFLALFASNRGRRPILSQRQAAAESDPAFWWNLMVSYVEAGKPLPDLAWPEEVWRAFRHRSDPNNYDANLVEAEMFSLPENQRTRDLLCALLACLGVSDEYVANVLRCDVEVIRLFHLLFFHVRPFLDDPQYVVQLLEPNADASGEGEQPSRGHELLRRAIETGDPAAVLAWDGVPVPGAASVPCEKLAEEIEHSLTAQTAQALAQGIDDPKQNRAIFLFLRYLLGRQRKQPLQEPLLFGFQMTAADLKSSIDDLNERLALEQRGYQQATGGPLPAPDVLSPPSPQNPKDKTA